MRGNETNGDITIEANFSGATSTLTVNKAGNGTGTVTGTGITCGGDCTEPIVTGTMVTLNAAPDVGSTFVGWSGGGCSGTGACVVTVNTVTTVTAIFGLPQFDLSVTKTGTGSGTVAGGGINCGVSATRSGTAGGTVTGPGIACPGDCNEPVPYGTAVTLTATADATNVFTGWSGDCSGLGQCTLTVNANVTANAIFATKQYPFTVAVSTLGGATGTVTSSQGGITCPGDCSESYDVNSTVSLSATPGVNSVFAGWGGACSGLGVCIVSVTQVTNVTALFAQQPNLMFVTSTTHTGNLGGLAGADNICNARAAAAGSRVRTAHTCRRRRPARCRGSAAPRAGCGATGCRCSTPAPMWLRAGCSTCRSSPRPAPS